MPVETNLVAATFEGKWRVIKLLDVDGTLAVEIDEKVLNLTCLNYPQPVSLAPTSPSSNRQPQYSIELNARYVLDHELWQMDKSFTWGVR